MEAVTMLKSDAGRTISYWEATGDLLETNGPSNDIATDVCIIGGGIAGLTTAYLLTKQGRQVVVVDDGLIGGGETCRTTAHLSNAIDDRIYRIEKWHGEDKAVLAVESHGRAIDEIERIITDEGIDCGFTRLDGYLFEVEDGEDDLDEELAAAHRAGLLDVEFVETPPIDVLGKGKCLRFPKQGQFHVLKYLSGVARAIERDGGRLFSHTKAISWTGGDSPFVEIDGGRTITARSIVLATNYPLRSQMFAELPAYRTYVIGMEMRKGSVTPALLWDNADPYIYVRTHDEADRQILIVGGEDHRTGQADDAEERFGRLREWAEQRFPVTGEPQFQWSGQFMETHDGLAFIGRYSSSEPNVYIITGDSGMGMTHGTIGGMLITDLITGNENPWADLYDPSRLATQSIREAVPEVVSSTVPYVDWLTGGDVTSEDQIENGQGAILREGLSKFAVYRDEDGNLHKRSAVCTHLGCIVRFNSLEKTWDCPCHGSRFGTDGVPVNLPAVEPLGPAEKSVGTDD
jgi:glycine/D-amino acid oxidase-like deaminating enzyme/nitrite reductase/ring-hydroxylating ferredoxin subunit